MKLRAMNEELLTHEISTDNPFREISYSNSALH